MLTQNSLRDKILVILGNVQMSKKTREKFADDAHRAPILELRERLIEIANELKSIYWIREENEKDGLLPHVDHGRDEKLAKEAKSIFKQMCDLNTEVG